MPGQSRALRKLKAIVRKGPATLRNIVFARFNYWPVGRIDGCDLQTMPMYCVSLTRAHGRRRLMAEQAQKMGLTNFQFVDAVDSRDISYEDLRRDGIYDEADSRKYRDRGLNLNELACCLAHARAYEAIIRNGDPLAVILEDDALFVTRRIRRFRLADVPPDFEVICLNSFRFDEPPRGHLRGMIYDDTSYSGSAAAYLVTQGAARKLMEAHRPICHAADGLLGRMMIPKPGEDHPFKQRGVTGTLKAYMVYPDLVINGSTSHYHVTNIGKGLD